MRYIVGHVELGAGVHALVVTAGPHLLRRAGRVPHSGQRLPQLPPGGVVVGRRNLAGVHPPAPGVQGQAEAGQRDLGQGALEQQLETAL